MSETMHAFECQALNKKDEIMIKVTKTRRSKWMYDQIVVELEINEYISGQNLQVTDIAGEMRKNRLRQFGHCLEKEITTVQSKRCRPSLISPIKLEVNRGRGRPEKQWMEVIRKDMMAYNVNEDIVPKKGWDTISELDHRRIVSQQLIRAHDVRSQNKQMGNFIVFTRAAVESNKIMLDILSNGQCCEL